jgi:hypothetical protein
VADARVEHGHQVEGLHHVRAVVAGQGHVGLEDEVAFDGLDLLDHVGLDLGRVAAGPQQRQHQRGELVAHGDGGEAHAHVRPGAGDLEGGTAGVLAVEAGRDLGRRDGGDLAQQLAHLGRSRAVVEARDQLDGLGDALEVGLELGLDAVVQHGGVLFGGVQAWSFRPR